MFLNRLRCFQCFLFLLVFVPGIQLKAANFIRGDVDGNGSFELTDPVQSLGFQFLGNPSVLACLDAADTDDTGELDISDVVYLLSHLYLGGPPPLAPFEACGEDPTLDDLTCDSAPLCNFTGLLKSDKAREESPDLNEGELEELVAGNTAFALDLYKALRGGDENLIFSPFSISVALAMTYAGARNGTARQMAEVFHFTLPPDRLHPAANALDLELESRGQGAAGHDGGGFQLNIVNAVWGQGGYGFLPDYLDVLAVNYGAGLRILDFKESPEESRLVINDWVSDQTADRIQDLLPPGAIDALTRLVLTNAVYFSAAWEEPFPEKQTQPGSFHLLDGGAVTVPLMSLREDFGYYAGADCQAVELPYDGKELSMVILLPPAGKFQDFEDSLDGNRLDEIVSNIQPSDINLTMPKFSFRTSAALNHTLAAMGMKDAFIPFTADFSGIDGTRDLYITSILHKAFIAVDEYGTEAAAATAVVIGITSVPENVRIDRPFIFLIRDIQTGAVLFLGRVMNPAV